MLSIKNLHVKLEEEDKTILKGVDLEIEAGKVHAIMGPNGSGKSTLSYVLSGKDGYEVTDGEALLEGEDVLDMEPEERAAAGLFLAFQYPVEIPGVGNMTFLRTAVNAQRKARGEDEVSAGGLPQAHSCPREGTEDRRRYAQTSRSTWGSRAVRRSGMRSSRWRCSSRRCVFLTKPTRALTSMR